MIARTCGTPAAQTPKAAGAVAPAVAANPFAAILDLTTIVPVTVDEGGAEQDETPALDNTPSSDSPHEAVLALIANALAATPPQPPAADIDTTVIAAAASGDAGPTPSISAAVAPAVAKDLETPASPTPVAAEVDADIGTLLLRLRQWAASPQPHVRSSHGDGSPTDTKVATATDAVAALMMTIPAAPAAAQPVASGQPQSQQLPAPDAAPVVDPSADIAATVMNHQVDLAHDGEWLDRLARDISACADHGARLRFQLNPEHLGSLHVEIAQGSDGASIRLTAETESARAILAGAEHRLVAEARAQGMRIAETRIDLGNQGMGQRHQGRPQAQIRVIGNGNEQPIASVETNVDAAERFA